ncbi:MAG: hypothetical protein KDK66_06475, partial [Deltaproteobacteria bacterium]|nr:hypothetical protein [Deltaproteobacteria bacterium]
PGGGDQNYPALEIHIGLENFGIDNLNSVNEEGEQEPLVLEFGNYKLEIKNGISLEKGYIGFKYKPVLDDSERGWHLEFDDEDILVSINSDLSIDNVIYGDGKVGSQVAISNLNLKALAYYIKNGLTDIKPVANSNGEVAGNITLQDTAVDMLGGLSGLHFEEARYQALVKKGEDGDPIVDRTHFVLEGVSGRDARIAGLGGEIAGDEVVITKLDAKTDNLAGTVEVRVENEDGIGLVADESLEVGFGGNLTKLGADGINVLTRIVFSSKEIPIGETGLAGAWAFLRNDVLPVLNIPLAPKPKERVQVVREMSFGIQGQGTFTAETEAGTVVAYTEEGLADRDDKALQAIIDKETKTPPPPSLLDSQKNAFGKTKKDVPTSEDFATQRAALIARAQEESGDISGGFKATMLLEGEEDLTTGEIIPIEELEPQVDLSLGAEVLYIGTEGRHFNIPMHSRFVDAQFGVNNEGVSLEATWDFEDSKIGTGKQTIGIGPYLGFVGLVDGMSIRGRGLLRLNPNSFLLEVDPAKGHTPFEIMANIGGAAILMDPEGHVLAMDPRQASTAVGFTEGDLRISNLTSFEIVDHGEGPVLDSLKGDLKATNLRPLGRFPAFALFTPHPVEFVQASGEAPIPSPETLAKRPNGYDFLKSLGITKQDAKEGICTDPKNCNYFLMQGLSISGSSILVNTFGLALFSEIGDRWLIVGAKDFAIEQGLPGSNEKSQLKLGNLRHSVNYGAATSMREFKAGTKTRGE